MERPELELARRRNAERWAERDRRRREHYDWIERNHRPAEERFAALTRGWREQIATLGETDSGEIALETLPARERFAALTRGWREEFAALGENDSGEIALETPRDFAAAARLAAETFNLPGAATWAAENEGAWTDATATAASEVPPNLATEDTEAWFNSGMARWN